MLHLRTSLLRVIPTSATSVSPAATRSFITFVRPAQASVIKYAGLNRAQRSAAIFHALRRSYATEGEQEKNSLDTSESVSETAGNRDTGDRDVLRARESGSDSFSEEARDAYGSVRDRVREQAGDAFAAAGAYLNPRERSNSSSFRRLRRSNVEEPTPEEAKGNLYIGNLFFETTEDQLKEEFERFGTVSSVKIVRDARGLSKGFGYVRMEKVDEAIEARETLAGQQLDGRTINVQHAISKNPKTSFDKFNNEPSRTLFIGNMSYDMKDSELNDLFKDIKNVIDIRVAIDRRTGTPRGFAHADFSDVASAEAAAQILRDKEFYGRRLRIDYSTSSSLK